MNRLGLALALLTAPGAASAQPPVDGPALLVIGFQDTLDLQVGGQLIHLKPDLPGYAIPRGVQVTVLQGDATLLSGGTTLRADQGDSFTYLLSDGRAEVLVHSGEMPVTPPSGAAAAATAGRIMALTGPDAGKVTGAPAVPAPPAAVAKEWDPLQAIAAGVSKLAEFKTPDMRYVIDLHPYYGLTQTYDDNIYLVPPDKADGSRVGGGVRGSWITTNVLGSKLAMPFSRRQRLELDYKAKLVNYTSQPRANNAVDQYVDLAYAQTGRRGTDWRVWDSYKNTEDPAFSELVARQRRFENEVGGRVSVARSRLFVFGLDGRHRMHRYLNDALASSLNRYELSAGFEAGIRLQPKTRLFLAYRREAIHYSAGAQNHSKSHSAGAGIDGRLTSKLTGRAQADLQFRRYDAAPAGGDKEIVNLLTSIRLGYKLARRTDLRFSAARSVQETTFDAARNRYYVASSLGLGATHDYRKLRLTADGSFETDRYPEASTRGGKTANRRDDVYSGSAGLAYKIRPWLNVGLSYQRLQRHSRFADDFDYRDNRTSLTLNIAL
ncbi:MAG: hypothetical protein A2X36_01635 [Elusimicrobia bacterium GWA2_69_24]|nr:MAG: hypothetical protein A2X36_01635 [Elusimicrobia bacterium GWA2_69_24]